MDLVQAEAVRDLVESHGFEFPTIAAEQFNGLLWGLLNPSNENSSQAFFQMETANRFLEEKAATCEREDLIKVLVKIDGRLRCLWKKAFVRAR